MIFVDRSVISARRPNFLKEFENDPLRKKQFLRISKDFNTPIAQRKWKEYNFQHSPGSIPEVREALHKVFANKCAYCEVKLDEGDRDTLTFFRPRQNALQELGADPDPNHYWWLSWEWSNLYLACPTCIRTKGRIFPTARKIRAKPGTLDIALQKEEPLLLDPCLDEPADHLLFRETGKVDPREGSKRGDITITILGLNRDTLTSKRRKHAHEIKALLKRSLQATERNKDNVNPRIASRIKELRLVCGADQQFAGMTRQLLSQWLREVELKTTVDFPLPSLGDIHWQELISQLQDHEAPSRAAASGRKFTGREDPAEITPMNGWPKSLVRAVEKGWVIPFAGSGVAMALRDLNGNPIVPDWRGLLDKAADWLEKEEQRPEEAELLRQRLSRGRTFAGAFRTAYEGLGKQFLNFLQDNLDPQHEQVDDTSLALARAVWRLNSNFVVTIGHDKALRWACPDQSALQLIEAAEVPDVMRRLGGGLLRPALWHAFGTLESGEPIITFDGIRNHLPDAASAARLSDTVRSLKELFAGPYPVMFIATSAPHFFSTELFKEASGGHYWLVRQEDLEESRESLEERDLLHLIQPVSFPDYESLPRLLGQLAARRRVDVTAPRPARKPDSAPPARPSATPVAGKQTGDLSGEAPPAQGFDVTIVCALREPELDKVLKTGRQPWEDLPPRRDDPHTYHYTIYTSRKGEQLRVVAAAPNQMGLAASAVLATKMILRFRPKLVAMVGIAAGVKSDSQGFGDILAAEHTFDYGAGKVGSKGGKLTFKPDPKPLDIDTTLNARLKEWQASEYELNDIRRSWPAKSPNTALALHVGPLGSGAAVIDNQRSVKGVMEHWRKLIGIEMEAYAVHRACKDAVSPAPMYLCLKSICDFAENKSDDWQPYAAFTAAELCHRFLVAEWENLFG